MLGVIGGLGSRASAAFTRKLVKIDRKKRFVLLNAPTTIDLPNLTESVQVLVNAGCTTIAILCNTAHLYLSQLQGAFPSIQFLNMVELVAKHIVSQSSNSNIQVALFTTKGVIQSRLYHDALENEAKRNNRSALVVTAQSDELVEEHTRCVLAIVNGENNFNDVTCAEYVREQILALKKQHEALQAVVLGCTDISDVILSVEDINLTNVVTVVDPLDILIGQLL